MIKLLKSYSRDNGGAMLMALFLFIPLFWLLLGLTLDGTNARFAAITAKTALNRAVKAAAAALDERELAQGIIRLEPNEARNNFDEILRDNLELTEDFTPAEESKLMEAPEILDFYICQGPSFPIVYNSVLGITHSFQDPGVLAVIKVKHKYVFTGREQEIYVFSAAEVKE